VRVLHLVSIATMTGPADPALTIAASQQRLLGWDVTIAFDQRRAGDMAAQTRAYGVPVDSTLVLCAKGATFAALGDLRRLRAASTRYDVIHAHHGHDHALAAVARPAGGARLVRSLHHPRALAARLGQRLTFARTDAFTVVAEAHRRRLLDGYPSLARTPVAVMPGAVDLERFHPARDGAAARRALGLADDDFVVGMVARFQAGRRQEHLLQAIEGVRLRVGVAPVVVLIGKGETQPALEAEIARLGVGAHVRLAGFRGDDLPDYVRACDVTVLLREGSEAGCRAVLQSMACGVPVVGAELPAIVDAIGDDGRAGWLVPEGDVDALAGALAEAWVMRGEPLRAMAREARARMEAGYSERARLERLTPLYTSARALR
jgi:glycosyltransferase involved in cell wall biosynthesis